MHEKLWGILARLGLNNPANRRERLLLISDVAGYPVASSKNLSESDVVRCALVFERLLERCQELGLLDSAIRGTFLVWAANDGVPMTLRRIERRLQDDVMRWYEESDRVSEPMKTPV
jgi:hypothetical protein